MRPTRLAGIAPLLLVAGCSQHSSSLDGADRGVLAPQLRLVVETGGDHRALRPRPLWNSGPALEELAAPDRYLEPERWVSCSGPEFEFTPLFGTVHSQVDAGEEIQFGDERLFGPASVTTKTQLYAGSACWREGFWYREWLGLEARLGIGGARTTYFVESAGFEERGSAFDGGPAAGLQLSARPLSWLTVYGRTGWIGGFRSNNGVNLDIRTLEVGGDLLLARNLSLFGAWRWLQLEDEGLTHSSPGHDNDVLFRFVGVVTGLTLRF